MDARSSGADRTTSNDSSWSRAASSSVPWPEASVNTVASGRKAASVSSAPRAPDDDGRLGIAEKVRQLALLITGVERQIDESSAQAREVERERLPALVDLYGDAVAGTTVRCAKRGGDARGRSVEIFVVE